MADDKSQRTEKPTAKRRRESRRKGQIARSPEISGWLAVLVGSELVPTIVHRAFALTSGLMLQAGDVIAHPSAGRDLAVLSSGLRGLVPVVAPVMAVLTALGVAVGFAQVGVAPTLHQLRPKLDRISPKAGLRRMVSPQSAWTTVKTVVRVSLLGVVGWRTIAALLPLLVGSGPMSLTTTAGIAAGRALGAVRTIAAVSLVVAAVDYGLQRRRVNQSLRMTREEIKEESRQSDGNPLIKGAVRRKQRAMSRQRMIAAVAGADTVLVNPTHVAVAIKYHPGHGAPRVVAKGADAVAARIRLEAEIHGVPLVRDIPLARALFAACELDDEIPRELYEAVARLLSFIWTLRQAGRIIRVGGGPHEPPVPLLAGVRG